MELDALHLWKLEGDAATHAMLLRLAHDVRTLGSDWQRSFDADGAHKQHRQESRGLTSIELKLNINFQQLLGCFDRLEFRRALDTNSMAFGCCVACSVGDVN